MQQKSRVDVCDIIVQNTGMYETVCMKCIIVSLSTISSERDFSEEA